MIEKNINSINKNDLDSLIENEVIESRTIEYKKILPSNSDIEKKEFLADITSFANASGGFIFYGIEEDDKTRAPKNIVGISIEDIDSELSRLDNIIRTGISPRIIGIEIRPLKLENSKYIIIIKIPKSWLNPHRVVYKDHGHFYMRSTNGKYRLDVSELRNQFNLSSTLVDRIKKFREDRISQIYSNDTPVKFLNSPKSILHIIPLISMNPGSTYDLLPPKTERLIPMYCTGWDSSFNFEGYIAYAKDSNNISHSYVQLFKSGIIEAVCDKFFYKDNDELYILGSELEINILQSIKKYFSVLQNINVALPYFIFFSILGVKNYSLYIKQSFRRETLKISKDVLLFPEVIVEYIEVPPHVIFHPIFDSLWNSGGFSKSPNYDEDGNYLSPRDR